jgi:C-terminal region of band_7
LFSHGKRKLGAAEDSSNHIMQLYIFLLAKLQGTTMLLPTAAGNPSSMIAQALAIYKQLSVSNEDSSHFCRKDPRKEIREETPSDDITDSAVSETHSSGGTILPHGTGFSLQNPNKGSSN